MGGKHNLANRTKNNARPSSSGRSAAILNSSLPQFGVFSGLKESSGLSSLTFTPNEEIDSSMEESFQLVIKKISKKDSTTKLKGLQEFAELVQNAEQEVVKGILPVWPRFYTVLATDPDNKVREATHTVHHKIVTKVKRNIAPYLKQLMAPWFTSQYDNYPPAATAAVQAFKDTFSEAKFKEAIVFCQEDILSYIDETFSDQVVQNVAGRKIQSNQDAETEAKYERMLIACLQGYSLYLEKVPEDKIKEMAELNLKIVGNKKFWKLATSKISLVKSAWFQVLSVVLQKAPSLLKDKESQILSIIANNLEDDDPVVVPYVWECLLLATSVIVDWWNYIKFEVVLIPKLITVLEQAGKGNANIIYPNLLPLLSNLPTMDKENASRFYNSFFEAIRSGLTCKSASSKSELTSVAAAFIECLQFLIIKKSSDIELGESIINHQLVATIETCVKDNNMYYKTIFHQTSIFVQYLSRSSNPESIQRLVTVFFDHILQMFSGLLQPDSSTTGNISSIADKQIELVRSLKQISKSKRNSHVKFVFKDEGSTHPARKTQENVQRNEFYLKLVDQLAIRMFQDYVSYVTKTKSKCLVDKLCSLVMDFDKNTFFDTLLAEIRINSKDATYVDVYENLLKKWLLSKNIYCRGVIDLIFLLMTSLQDSEKEAILNDLIKINQPDCLTWSVSTALSYPHIENATIQKWLQQEEIGSFFISIVEKQICNECPPELGVVLKLALTENINGDLIVTKDVLKKIIEKVSSTLLEDEDNIFLELCSGLAAHLSSIIYTDTLLLTYGDELLITLLEMTCKFESERENLSAETIWEIKSTWQDALVILLSNLSKEEGLKLMDKIAATIENKFYSASDVSRGRVEHVANVIAACIRAICKSESPAMSLLIKSIFERPWTVRNKMVVELCKVAEYIKGNMSCLRPDDLLMNGSLNEKELMQYFTWCFVKLHALCSSLDVNEPIIICKERPVADDELPNEYIEPPTEEDNEPCEESPQLLEIITNSEDYLLELLYSYAVGESFLIHFRNVKFYKEISSYIYWLGEKLKETFVQLDDDQMDDLKIILRNKCLDFGWFWCKAGYTLYTKFLGVEDYSSVYSQLTEGAHEDNMVGVMHLKEIFRAKGIQHIAKLDDDVTKTVEQMVKLRNENMSEFLYDNPENMLWENSEKVIEAVRLSSQLIKSCPLTRTNWDFIVISLASWISNCLKARNLIHKCQYQSMLISVSELYINTSTRILKFKEENVNTSYVNEWEDVLLESIHADFAQLWLFLAERLSMELKNPILNLPFIQYFGAVTEHLRYEFIFKPNDNFPKWTKFLKRSCSLLTNTQTSLQLWGYRMLKILIPGLVKIDAEAVDTRTPHKKGLIFEQFKEKLTEVQNVVNSMLMDFRVGENTCRVEPSYDSFTYTFAYLLLWDLMLSLCEQATAELRYQYSDWLKNGDFLQFFLSNIFKLISFEIIENNEGKLKAATECFLKNPLDCNCYNRFCDGETIEQMVCYLYKTSLVQLPALVRQWWTDLDVKASQLVDRITTLYVAPHLCTEELNDVMQYQNAFKNMKVKVMPAIREILAVYTVDETQMELTITLPMNYPLGSPNVQCNKQISGANQKQWLLQFKKCVLHQNGRIWDGLSLWNSNLDRKFDGVEECFICYAVLHFGTCQLPRLSCQTCKKKFHSACLYKWFSTSNKSSCPICRNLF